MCHRAEGFHHLVCARKFIFLGWTLYSVTRHYVVDWQDKNFVQEIIMEHFEKFNEVDLEIEDYNLKPEIN